MPVSLLKRSISNSITSVRTFADFKITFSSMFCMVRCLSARLNFREPEFQALKVDLSTKHLIGY